KSAAQSSRFMGTSIAMIDRHYGHLANASRDHAVALLDALAFERAVDAAWTLQQRPARPLNQRNSRPRGMRTRQVVDARWTLAPRFRRVTRRRKKLISRDEAKPSRGLEPRTPSLPWRLSLDCHRVV